MDTDRGVDSNPDLEGECGEYHKAKVDHVEGSRPMDTHDDRGGVGHVAFAYE